jgi:hypothetical protein
MPDTVDLRRLYYLVVGAYPMLEPRRRDPNEAFENFVRVFYRIGHLGRSGKLDGRFDLLSWADDATIWLRNQGGINLLRVLPADFFAALIAHHDIDHPALDNFPHDCSAFNLNRGRWGRPATDAWRRLLETRTPRPPWRSP